MVAEREKLCQVIASAGISFIPSQGNFVALPPQERYQRIWDALASRGTAVRNFVLDGKPALRLTVGSPKENQVLAQALLEAAR